MSLTAEQCRAARAMLNVKQIEIAERANLSESTVRDFEKGRRVPSINNLKALRSAFEEHGLVFLGDGEMAEGGPGVRRKGPA